MPQRMKLHEARGRAPLCPDQKLQEREPLGPGSEKWDPGLGVPCDAGGPDRRATRDGRWVAVA